jgi:hypothetical protein
MNQNEISKTGEASETAARVRGLARLLSERLEAVQAAGRDTTAAHGRLRELEAKKATLLSSVTQAADGSGDDAALAELGRLNAALEIAKAAAVRAEGKEAEAQRRLDSENAGAKDVLFPICQGITQRARAVRVDSLANLVASWVKPALRAQVNFTGNEFRRTLKEAVPELLRSLQRGNKLGRESEIEFGLLSRAQLSQGDAAAGSAHFLRLAEDVAEYLSGQERPDLEALAWALAALPPQREGFWSGGAEELLALLPADSLPVEMRTVKGLETGLADLMAREPGRQVRRDAESARWIVVPVSLPEDAEEATEPAAGASAVPAANAKAGAAVPPLDVPGDVAGGLGFVQDPYSVPQ